MEWVLRRAQVVDDMEVGEYIETDTLTEQFRLLDVWLDDMVIGYKVTEDESACPKILK